MENQSKELSRITAAFVDQVQNLQNLAEQVSRLGDQISKIGGDSNKFDRDFSAVEKIAPNSERNNTVTGAPNIIPFPQQTFFVNQVKQPSGFRMDPFSCPKPILATPGKVLPSEIPDFRPFLQRDGLILLAWDKRRTEAGSRFTAYWVTSTGTPRYYASKMCSSESFSSAKPDHKSYAAEDGIEFHGQKAPVYIVHTAPELMMSNPRHRELRKMYIDVLMRQGVTVDFGFRYLLKNDKKLGVPSKMPAGRFQRKTGA